MSMDGVAGIFSPDDPDLIEKIFLATGALQHRGKASAGLAVLCRKGIYHFSGLGRMGEIMNPDLMRLFQDHEPIAAIGNVGYTKNKTAVEYNAEPIIIDSNGKSDLEIAVTMDGYLLKEEEIKAELSPDYHFKTTNKTEVMGALLHKHLSQRGIGFEAGEKFIDDLHGKATFALTALVYDKSKNKRYLVSLNDDRSFEPMCYGTIDGAFVTSSESVSHRRLGGHIKKECDGAEMTICSEDGIETKTLSSIPLMRDAFYPAYYGHVGSLFKGKPILLHRVDLGRGAVDLYGLPQNVERIIANPDSGRGVTLGIFERMKELLYEKAVDESMYHSQGIIQIKDKKAWEMYNNLMSVSPALVKQAQAVRTFQESVKSQRFLETGLKFGAVDYQLKGLEVDEGDDSTVKGSVGEGGSIWTVYNAGAKKLRRWISYGPMLFPSFKEWHRGITCLKELAVQRAFADDNPYDKSLEEINERVSRLVLSNMPQADPGWVEFFYNDPKIVKQIIGDGCSYQAMDASYPIAERFWPDWIKVHADFHDRFHRNE